ncbi:MAG: hypothetical protein ACTSU7_00995 [Candidatus Heimdallarchaeaceae archaeon]
MIDALKYSPATTFNWKRLDEGSVDYELFWEQELDRCLNGYKPTGGTWISGQYYFYLNYCKIDVLNDETGRRNSNHPYYRDQDHEYFNEIHNAKQNGHGLIVLKARRKGFSVMNANGVMLHEYCFYPDSENGVGAQKEDYVQDFRSRLIKSYHELPWQLRPKELRNNEELLMSGYKEKQDDGSWKEMGMKSQIHFRVMEKPNAFRGTALTFMIFEEAGEFLNLKKSYQANEECFKDGIVQYGVPIIGGTSNQMSIESEDFQEMFYHPEDYNLKALFISASKVLRGYFDFTKGKSDVENAEKHIRAEQLKRKQANDISNYFAYRQEMPITPEDAFVSIGSSPFDLELINERISIVRTNPKAQIMRKGKLVWPKNEKGKSIFGALPHWVYDDKQINENDPSRERFPFYVVEDPITGIKNGDVAAIDPYHVDDVLDEMKKSKPGQDLVSKRSKGAMCVYRNYIDMNTPGEMPVAFYVDRPKTKEEFYENCAKLAVYYNCKILVENNDEPLIKYFIKNGLSRFLKERPRSADAPYSKATNKFGINMKGFQKSMLTDLVDEYIKKNIDNIYFLSLLKEFTVYGKKNTDWVMAFGMALIHASDNDIIISANDGMDAHGDTVTTRFNMNSSGNVNVDNGNGSDGRFTSFNKYGW